MGGQLPLSTIIGLTIAAMVAIVAWRSLYDGLRLFAILAAIPVLEVGAFSGMHMTEGLLMSEVLATVLIVVYFAKHPSGPSAGSAITRPLVAFLAVSCVSLMVGRVWYDPAIDFSHLNLFVSLGQVLLFAWPVGVYVVAANVIKTPAQAVWIVRAMQAMSLVQPVMAFVPLGPSVYLAWTWYFGLFAAPFSFAEAWDTRSFVRRLGLLFLALAPLAKAVVDGRAFIYVTLSIALIVVSCVKLRGRVLAPLAALACAYAFFVALSGSWMPSPLTTLVNVERSQQSLGGPAGRGALLADAIAIWAKHPIFGVGPGNSYPYMLRYSRIGTPHDQYANILLELGIMGLAVFLEFIRRAILLGLRSIREAESADEQWLATGWLAILMGLVVGTVAGDFMFHSIRNGGIAFFSQFYLQWVLLGAVVALDHRRGLIRQPQRDRGLTPWSRYRRSAA